MLAAIGTARIFIMRRRVYASGILTTPAGHEAKAEAEAQIFFLG